MGIIGIMLEAQASYVREYQDLYQRFLMLKSGRLPDGRALNSGRLSEIAEQVAQMTSPVRTKLARLSEGSFTDAQLREAVADLQQVVKEQIRPLSHRLWFDRTSHLLKFKLSNLLLDAFKTDETPILFHHINYIQHVCWNNSKHGHKCKFGNWNNICCNNLLITYFRKTLIKN